MEHSLVTLEKCPSCGNNSFTNHLSAIDYTYSQRLFSLVKCSSCTLVFTNPRPDESSIAKYYDNPDYVSHTDTKKGVLFTIYSLVKTRALKQKRKLLERKTDGRTVLDYGAGTGDFSAELANNGWSVSSYEPDPTARAKINKKSAKISLTDSINSLETNSYSCVTLWHVLEHVHQLKETILSFHNLLEGNGKLVIAVPNYHSYDAEYYQEHWAAYDVPRHLYHFDFKSMKTLVENQGFKLNEIKPMWFDSTYVSLLSEKNQNGASTVQTLIGWVRASIIGLLSNISAIREPKRCSSIIYIFEKAK